MLQFEKARRMNWDQLFYHPLLRSQLYDMDGSMRTIVSSIFMVDSKKMEAKDADPVIDVHDIDQQKEHEYDSVVIQFKKKQ
jgi:hypothetical protein